MEKNHSKRTQTRDRSEGKLGLFFFFGKFSIYGEKEFRGVILGNQKLLIPNMLRVTARVARSSRIPGDSRGGFAVEKERNRCGSGKHEEHGE